MVSANVNPMKHPTRRERRLHLKAMAQPRHIIKRNIQYRPKRKVLVNVNYMRIRSLAQPKHIVPKHVHLSAGDQTVCCCKPAWQRCDIVREENLPERLRQLALPTVR